MLERNPQLKKYWLGRWLVGPILAGAQLGVESWKHVRLSLIAAPMLSMVFGYNMLHDANASIADNIIDTMFVVCFTLGWPLIGSMAYGYKNKSRLDTTGAMRADFRNMGRYMLLWCMIGVGISSGVGIFSWLKW